MPRIKKSEFHRLRRKFFIDIPQAAELFQVTERTIRNWDKDGAPPLAMRLLAERSRELGSLHPQWHGFKIDLRGKLRGPGGLIVSPEALRRMILHYRSEPDMLGKESGE